ncbi:hypothetical protein EN858_15100 [Mesorhizobium sp. M4B.F.Ca.ET.215.01.1.1]|uniref:hypothetical protein n=1 Tax=unclassified Mesorhizobium TaxID=325217 RepID=UPI001093A2E4|nr:MULTISPECIES: hypothetical protein [unclassified Mesorhizobium]TGQ11246.1 hypothetical protein EN858_15100 [Mesorhizobium sp. M4B.F.Ca.ET.215.01.1.1]TGR04701.1 hypothetical protein EN846_12980 [Mesorhizobium sp. M4B.F.Ca.ET.203.01.1.1]
MKTNVVAFPKFTKFGPSPHTKNGRDHRARLARLFAGKTIADMRRLWDAIDDETSFSGPYDCADIHSYMNMLGDGRYCAV